MLTKLLVTLLVVVIGWKVIAKRQSANQIVNTSPAPSFYNKKVTATVAVVLLLVAAIIVGWQWWLGFEQVQVTIGSPQHGTTETYTVRKRDISDNKIVTVDGITIRLSQQERVEIAP
ncbi:hypothetical protein [Shewanella sp.]|uniref:hypothetical protein n=1 Tax=Shewanella sp. TaxID=50422 RepID=UPI003A97A840